MDTERRAQAPRSSEAREVRDMRSVSSGGELPRRGQLTRRVHETFTAVGPAEFGVKMVSIVTTSLEAHQVQGVGGLGDWEIGRGLGRGPMSQSCALGTSNSGPSNPRA